VKLPDLKSLILIMAVAPFATAIIIALLGAAVLVSPLVLVGYLVLDKRKYARRNKILDLMKATPPSEG
jgi:hypothetical protein